MKINAFFALLGQTATLEFTPTQSGPISLSTWCTLPGHRERGMVGTILVV